MTDLSQVQAPIEVADTPADSRRQTLVLVAGSGRSGTSLFTGTMQRLGFYVPQPEVPADETNPRGFAESQWVVGFHTRLLKKARIQVSDARPSAWADAAQVCLSGDTSEQLKSWLRRQFREADDIIIKDPRLSWFLPLWRRTAEELGASPRFVTVLRHPAAVIDSKQRSYGGWQGEVGRTAGWLNQSLFTERATRGALRAFVRYQDLLDDWTKSVGRLGDELDLKRIRDMPAAPMAEVHQFVDRTLSRSRTSWGDIELPGELRRQADEVWELLSALADDEARAFGGSDERLDAARAAYTRLYEDAEAIAHSSIVSAAKRGSARAPRRVPRRVVRLAERVVPERYRRKVPRQWRRVLVRVLYADSRRR